MQLEVPLQSWVVPVQMVARGGIEEMCSLLLLVAQEEAERVHRDAASESPEAPGDQKASSACSII